MLAEAGLAETASALWVARQVFWLNRGSLGPGESEFRPPQGGRSGRKKSDRETDDRKERLIVAPVAPKLTSALLTNSTRLPPTPSPSPTPGTRRLVSSSCWEVLVGCWDRTGGACSTPQVSGWKTSQSQQPNSLLSDILSRPSVSSRRPLGTK